LFEIHPNRVIENIQFLVLVVLLLIEVFFPIFIAVHLGSIDDIHLHGTQPVEQLFHLIRIDHPVRKGLVNIVVGEITLFLRELNEFAQALLEIKSGICRR
jgi:hypothetical protein